jgi:hypothetical protein
MSHNSVGNKEMKNPTVSGTGPSERTLFQPNRIELSYKVISKVLRRNEDEVVSDPGAPHPSLQIMRQVSKKNLELPLCIIIAFN